MTPVPADDGLTYAAEQLLAGVLAQPWGQLSPSVYETARVATLAPWLPGQRARWEFLLERQQPDGWWGGHEGYRLVPTLSATEALLTALLRDRPDETTRGRLLRAVDAGLHALTGLLRPQNAAGLPDTVAVELIVPALVEELNLHLARLAAREPPALERWHRVVLSVPPQLDLGVLANVRAGLRAGAVVPTKLLHSFEVVGATAGAAVTLDPVGGAVGCSPAATAAWLAVAGHGGRRECVGYLQELTGRYGGPVPSVVPISVFERTWVLADLVRAQLAAPIPPALVESLSAAVADGATPGAPGLPADADTTSATLFTLSRLGHGRRPDALSPYELPTHFCTWPGEQTASPTTNAHVLAALTEHVATRPGDAARYQAAIAKTARWLGDRQRPDGSWSDKWHASPYYATACCVQALVQAGGQRAAVRRAVSWVLDSQRPDGSWGRWAGTAEETAYALQLLVHAGTPLTSRSVVSGHEFLLDCPDWSDPPALWQDKDLYAPTAVVQATVLAALHLVGSGQRSPRLVGRRR